MAITWAAVSRSFFVRQDPAGVMPLSRPEPLCHFLQISRLIVGVKRTALQPRPSVNDTDVQFRAKLHRLSRFSPHNGPNEGLAHADGPVKYAVSAVMILHRILPADFIQPGSANNFAHKSWQDLP